MNKYRKYENFVCTLKSHLADYGSHLVCEKYPLPPIHNFIDKRSFDAVILGWSLARDPDQYAIWHSEETKEGKYNFVSYNNPEVDSLLIQGRRTFDLKKSGKK